MPYRLQANYEDQLLLTGVRPSPVAVTSGYALPVDTRWQTLAKMTSDYSVSLSLVDAKGLTWAQLGGLLWDHGHKYTKTWEPGQVVLQQQALNVLPGTPPGTYYLTAKVYERYAVRTLLPKPGDYATLPGGDVVIGPVQVVLPAGPPPIETLAISATLPAELAPGLSLLGSPNPLPLASTAGHPLDLGFYWRSTSHPPVDDRLEFHLYRGERVEQRWTLPIAAQFPTSAWRGGEVVLGRYRLPLDAHLATGPYALRVAALGGTAEATLINDLVVQGRPDAATLQKAITHSTSGFSFAEHIGLLGYDVSTETLDPGQTLKLTLYWLCQQPPVKNYTVFAHLLDDQSQVQGQDDATPDEGRAPTYDWVAGDIIVDHYEIPLKADAPAGTLHLEIGFYDPLSGERLKVWANGQETDRDHLILPTTITAR
jgi:hypothetical protein